MVKNLMLRAELWDLVKQGKKRITIRRRLKLAPGDRVRIHAGGKIVGEAIILKVYRKRMEDIGEEEARKEGIPLDRLKKMLREFYGDNPGQELEIAEFELIKTYDPPLDPEKLRYGSMTPQEVAKRALDMGIVEPRDAEIVEKIARYGSIRRVAFEIGGLWKRKHIRRILEKYRRKLEEITS